MDIRAARFRTVQAHRHHQAARLSKNRAGVSRRMGRDDGRRTRRHLCSHYNICAETVYILRGRFEATPKKPSCGMDFTENLTKFAFQL